ncbi:hypothetical protein CK203_055699 [Vitis vinifera]|uniref:Retrotransposon gag domain-containing protein n=1 Tax=Vitis vinifera TaxID=29760 RepID=A0A438FVD3_VITVI|nr:hypothetical protein CK203_055699 [Vitis vinifera]
MGYIDVWEHSGGGRHTDVGWSPIFEDLYSPMLGNPLGCRGSACVEVMTTLHGSALSLQRRAEGCRPLEGVLIRSIWVQLLGSELESQIEVAPLPTMVVVLTLEDAHARMDRLEQRMRQLRLSDEGMVWDDFDGLPVASLLAKFKMLEIEQYTGIGFSCIHLRLYSTVMRAHGLDEAQMIILFPMSLSEVGQRWFASLDMSGCRTWDALAQEFLR